MKHLVGLTLCCSALSLVLTFAANGFVVVRKLDDPHFVSRWTSDRIPVFMIRPSLGPNEITQSDFQSEIVAALKAWHAVAPKEIPSPAPGPFPRDLEIPNAVDIPDWVVKGTHPGIYYIVDGGVDALGTGTFDSVHGVTRPVIDLVTGNLHIMLVFLGRYSLQSTGEFRRAVLHETGHAFGLPNIVVDSPDGLQGILPATSQPVMFPYFLNPLGLMAADKASIQYIYAANRPGAEQGAIQGQLRLGQGKVIGLNVIAIRRGERPDRFSATSSCFEASAGDFIVPVGISDSRDGDQFDLFVESPREFFGERTALLPNCYDAATNPNVRLAARLQGIAPTLGIKWQQIATAVRVRKGQSTNIGSRAIQ